MNPRDFTCREAGRVVQGPLGYAAFVPALLPPAIADDEPLVLLLSRADAALGELSGQGIAPRSPGVPAWPTGAEERREPLPACCPLVRSSSAIAETLLALRGLRDMR